MTAGMAAAVLLAAGLGIWVASSKTASSTSTNAPEHQAATRKSEKSLPDFQSPQVGPVAGGNATFAVGVPPGTEQSGPELLDQWLSSSADPDEVGLTLMQGFSKLPADTHAAAARQMVNLVPDAHFDGMLRHLLNPTTSPQAKEIIFQDVMIRPDPLRLPALLEVMRKPEHPQAEDARLRLGNILGGDWGADLAQWQARVDAELRRQKAAGG